MNTNSTNTNSNETSAAAKPAGNTTSSLPYRSTLHPTLRALWNIPHVIRIPDPMPPVAHVLELLQQLLTRQEQQLARLNFENPDHHPMIGAYKADIAILKHKIEEVLAAFPDLKAAPTIPSIQPIPMAQLTNKKNPEITEPGEPAVQPQQHPTEPQVSPTEPGSLTTEPGEPTEPAASESETGEHADFASALKKIPAEYHQIAADLYEIQHYRSKFSTLTSAQRQAIFELDLEHERKAILQIIAQPAPVGMNFHTSLAGLKRFLRDYERILMDDKKLENHRQHEQERLAAEQSFQTANASDESFRQAAERQIRKRLFDAANNPKSDHHEIRWLIKSLELLRKPTANSKA